MDSLPEELQLRILEYLPSAPPSETRARHEPRLELTAAEVTPLKQASCVSRALRRIALPILFHHARLRIDGAVRPHWLRCCLLDEHTLKHQLSKAPATEGEDQYHLDMVIYSPGGRESTDPALRKTKSTTGLDTYESDSAIWASRMYHASKDFLDFITANRLQTRISSFALLSGSMALVKNVPTVWSGRRDWRYHAAAAMWQHILSIVDPTRITIVAPPQELACFCNTFIKMDAGKSHSKVPERPKLSSRPRS